MKEIFRNIASRISYLAGSASVFVGALLVILVWAATGPLLNFSDTWQLVINTGTTIVTFMMVFLIQNTQNRDAKAVHLKLDELIRSTKTARDAFVSLEDISDEELAEITNQFKKLHDESKSTKAMLKLHEKLQAEKTHRLNLKETTGRVVSAVLSPLENSDKDQH